MTRPASSGTQARRVRSTGMIRLLALAVLGAAPPLSAQVEVAGATITELQDLMSSGGATSAEITQAYLDRIAAYDQVGPAINAMIWLNAEAIADAEALDRERAVRGPRGPLHGIPIILKDNYDTADLPTTAGTLALAGFVPPDPARRSSPGTAGVGSRSG